MKKSKLICELIFIFLLPLVFLSFNISIDQEYVYDDNGNFKTSGINLEFNNINFINDVEEVNVIGYEFEYYEWEDFLFGISQTDDLNPYIIRSFYVDFNKIDFSYLYFFSDDSSQSEYVCINLFSIIDTSNDVEFYYSILWNIEDYASGFYTLSCVDVSDNVFSGLASYYFSPDDFFPLGFFDYIDASVIDYDDLSLDDFNYYFDCPFIKNYIPIENKKFKNPIYEICVQLDNYIGFDYTSTTMQIINAYTTLWVLMFFIWHLLYMFLDFFPHLFERKRE